MDTGKIYRDTDGNKKTIHQMVRGEPHWAANRIQEGEKAIKKVDRLEEVIQRALLVAKYPPQDIEIIQILESS